MGSISINGFVIAVLQGLLLLALAPLMSGVSRKIRAKMHSRQGPPTILQDYLDLLKLLKRQEVAPAGSGAVFRVMPYVLIGTMLVVAMALPIFTVNSQLVSIADLITLIYLFALYRFFFSLSGLDSGSPFAGLGASRELVIGVLVEPILMLSLLVMALISGSTNIGAMSVASLAHWGGATPVAAALAMVACGFAVFIEMGKIPFDYPEAEQELQEGPLTEYSGVGFALVKLGINLKQVVIASLFISVFIPFGSAGSVGSLTGSTGGGIGALAVAFALFVVKLLAVFIVASVYENTLARGRFLLTSRVTWAGFGVAALAFVFYLTSL